jgi:hypothetical protein
VPFLKVLNRIYQWPNIGSCIRIGNSALRQVAKQAKSFTQLCCTNILIAVFQGLLWIGQRFAMVLGRQGQISEQRGLGSLVAYVLGFYLVQYVREIAPGQNLLHQKLWQIVVSLVEIDAKLQGLRIYSADAEIGEIPDRIDRQSGVKLCHGICVSWRGFECNQSRRPARCIVVFRNEPFLLAVLERRNDGEGLWRRLSFAHPRG